MDAGVRVVEERESREGRREKRGWTGSGQRRGCIGATGPSESLEEGRRPRGLGGMVGSP